PTPRSSRGWRPGSAPAPRGRRGCGRSWNAASRAGSSDLRRLLVLVGAIVLVDTMFYAALTPLLPHYAQELGLSKAGAGVLAGAYAVGALVGGIPSGMLVSRFGVKPTILLGLGLMIATTALFGFAQSE